MDEFMKKWKQSEEYNPVRESAQKSVREWRRKSQVKKKVQCEEESQSEDKNPSEVESLSEE